MAKKFDINQIFYIKTIISKLIRSFCYSVVRICRNLIQNVTTFIRHHKQNCIKLAVPLLIILVAYHACSAAQRAIKQNIQEIFVISDEIRTHYANKPDYWGLGFEEIIKQKLIPGKFLKNNKIVLSSGIPIAIGSGANADTVMPFSQTFDVVLKNLNKAQCISYAEAPLSDENLIKLYSISILNSSGSFVFEWGGDRKLPISRYATKDLCTDAENTLIWSIK